MHVDVVVVGGGPAGENVAGRCAAGGLSVALAERELVGGECSYWGCIPSKTLLRPGDVLAAARRVPGAREAVTGGVAADAALARRDAMVGGWDDSGQLPWLDDAGVILVRGHARLAGERVVEVTGGDGVRTLHAGRAVVLATGTTAALPPVPGLAEARPWDNRDATAAKEVPRRLAVLGGGAIGVEMAQAFRRLGAEAVTVVEVADRLLAREEPFAGEQVAAALAAEGIDVRLGRRAARVARPGPDGPVTVTLDEGAEVVADELLVAAGRRPATVDVGVDSVGLEPGSAVQVDDQLRATAVGGGWLYAVGDVNGRALLTHMGKAQARAAADVILGKPAATPTVVPRVTFTDPQVAAVGLTESEARAAGTAVRVVQVGLDSVAATATLGGRIRGTAQLVVDPDRGVVIGATFTGPGTGELLHAATIAIVGEVPLERLWQAVPAFPTLSEVWLRLLESYGL